MPAWSVTGLEITAPPEAAFLIWSLCALFALLFAGALGAFLSELWPLLRGEPRMLPATEFQGFGRPVRRRR
jgi:hypothetical protein